MQFAAQKHCFSANYDPFNYELKEEFQNLLDSASQVSPIISWITHNEGGEQKVAKPVLWKGSNVFLITD